MPIDETEQKSSNLKKELEASRAKISFLEKENQELRQEVGRLSAQVNTLRAHDLERKSMLWKKLQNSMDAKVPDRSLQKPTFPPELPEHNTVSEKLDPKEDLLKSAVKEERLATSPKQPPPRPTLCQKEAYGNKLQSTPTPPPPATSPPPPPPLPSKLLSRSKALRRMPEVMEFYRSLMKRDAHKESRTGSTGNLPGLNPRNMIGEIENRSTYLLNIKSDVETHGELINFLARQVEAAALADISEVESFVKWLDGELSRLVDERAVLKHFSHWPERKADALREAACSYRDLRSLQSEVSSYKDNPKQQLSESLRKLQALQDRLERSVNNVERVREGTSKKYRELHIPWAWMLDTGVIGQKWSTKIVDKLNARVGLIILLSIRAMSCDLSIDYTWFLNSTMLLPLKFGSVTLAKHYMKRIARELQSSEVSQEEDLLLQGVRFAYRVHQFAGGFDTDTMQAFEELRRIGIGCQKY